MRTAARIQRLVLLVIILLIGNKSLLAQHDTISIIGEPMKHDTLEAIRIFRHFTWHVTAKRTNGQTMTFVGSKVDTFLQEGNLDTVRMYADVYVADTNLNKLLYMHCKVDGSLLASVNGVTLTRTGHFGWSREQRQMERDEYAPFIFKKSPARIDITYIAYKTHEFALTMSIFDKEIGEMKLKQLAEDNEQSFAHGCYYLAFGIVFLTMFIFFRERKEHLYFSLFCLFASASFLWPQLHSSFLYQLHSFLGIFSFEFLSIFFSKVLKNKEKSKIGLLVITAVLLICFIPAIRYSVVMGPGDNRAPWFIIAANGILYPYVWISSLYYLVRGIGEKRWEARAVLVTCLVPIALFLLLALILIFVAAVNVKSATNNQLLPQLMEYLAVIIIYVYPLAAVFILGKRNALNQRQLTAQLASIQQLSEENITKEKEKQDILARQNERLEEEVAERTAEIQEQKNKIEKQHDELKVEKGKSDELLRNILPQEVADELKEKGSTAARHFERVTVLFADFVDFTSAGERMTPQELVNELHICFKAFDDIMADRGIEKIKTIGDAYLAVCGLPVDDEAHAQKIVDAAKEIVEFMKERATHLENKIVNVRVGIHSGSVVAGIVGVKKFAYDIWGDTVNTAARMQQASEPGKINISQATYNLVKDSFSCTYRGEIEVKGKGLQKMYFVE